MRWFWVALFAFVLKAAQPAFAQQSAPAAQQFGGWSVIELAPANCVLHQRLALRQTRQTIADLWLQAQQGGSLVLSVQVPVGASLSDLMAYRHTNDPTRIVPLIWQFCNATHCLAQAHLHAHEADRLRQGHFLEVVFRPLPDSPPLISVISLSGVTRGLVAQQKCTGTVSSATGDEHLP
jgi:invasion protein IalB